MGKQRRAGRARGGAQQRLPPGGDTHAAAAHLVAAPREWEELVPRGVFARDTSALQATAATNDSGSGSDSDSGSGSDNGIAITDIVSTTAVGISIISVIIDSTISIKPTTIIIIIVIIFVVVGSVVGVSFVVGVPRVHSYRDNVRLREWRG
jgi:hypothetical protein